MTLLPDGFAQGCFPITLTKNVETPTAGDIYDLQAITGNLFSYQPYTPEKEIYYQQTATGLARQVNAYDFLSTTKSVIKWKIDMCTLPIAQQMYDLYLYNGTMLFSGVYGEDEIEVDFIKFEVEMTHGWPKLTGEFRVLCAPATEPTTKFDDICVEDTP